MNIIPTLYLTSPEMFSILNNLFDFKADVAASDKYHLCETYFTTHTDGLKMDWPTPAYLNPPSVSTLHLWLAKAHYEASLGKVVVCYTHKEARPELIPIFAQVADYVDLGEMCILVFGDEKHRIYNVHIPDDPLKLYIEPWEVDIV